MSVKVKEAVYLLYYYNTLTLKLLISFHYPLFMVLDKRPVIYFYTDRLVHVVIYIYLVFWPLQTYNLNLDLIQMSFRQDALR